jgi:6-phospho-beta-glucosidase
MKVATIGGGSTYSPELAQGLIDRCAKLGIREWWLMDTDAGRLEIVGGFVKRMVATAGNPFRVQLTTDLATALKGADFVVAQIRVGGMAARRGDEYLGRRWGLVGQETTGIGGMACALRTIPVMLSVAKGMETLCPGAWLVNFTNPSGLVVEALQRHAPRVRTVGLCNSPIGYQMVAARALHLTNPFEVHLDYLGLNHLAWIRGARAGGQDVWQRVFRDMDPAGADQVAGSLGVVWNYYLRYYYSTSTVIKEQAAEKHSRAEEVMEIEKKLLERYADPALDKMPPELMQRGGAYYSTAAAQLIEAIALDLGEVHIVNTRQAGAVPGMPADWVMELPCQAHRDGIRPLAAEPLPLFAEGLLRAVKAYELLTVQAATTGDRKALLAALIVHPLGPEVDQAPEVLEDLLQTNREHLPAFFQAGPAGK